MAKKRKSKKTKVINEKLPKVEEITQEPLKTKSTIFQKIYNVSIYRFRVLSLLLILVGVYFVTLGVLNFMNVNFYSKGGNESIEVGQKNEENGNGNDGEKSIGTGIDTSLEEEVEDASTTESQVNMSASLARLDSLQRSQDAGVWVATDYNHGDIEKGTYTVVKGDTLWEISEAVYGNGQTWPQILAANSNSIGFLPDGSQALIVPGQILVLP